jgi:digeranylgeranylglycerophospholipid reductase
MKYDIVIIGGGPGGAVAAKTCAEKGLNVLLIEKRSKIGDPVRCGELIPGYILNEFDIGMKDCYNAVSNFECVSPEKQKVCFNFLCYMLDRRVFDSYLVSRAEDAGADVWLRARASDLIPGEREGRSVFKGVKISKCGKNIDVWSYIIVAADGVESQVGRMAGIDTLLKLQDIASAAAAVVKGVNTEEGVLKNYYLRDFAPGYLWIFPKGENKANVSVGFLPTKNIKPITLLKFYMKKMVELRDGEICYYTSGGVPMALGLEKLFFKNILFVGDAARLSDPMSGAGLSQAMVSGKLAAETAVKSIEYDDINILKKYEWQWERMIYESWQYEQYAIKGLFLSMDTYSRLKLLEGLWSTAAREHVYPFRLSNVIKQKNTQLKLLKVLIQNNRLRRWAVLDEPLRWLRRRGASWKL